MKKRKFKVGDKVLMYVVVTGVDDGTYLVKVGQRVCSLWFRESELKEAK